MRIRQLHYQQTSELFTIWLKEEVDKCYLGGKRKGLGGRGATSKVAVYGLLKHGGKVYTAIIPNAKTET